MLQYNVDYFVHPFPFHSKGVHEAVHQNEDGTFTIFVKNSLSIEKQREVVLHALSHICNNDFEKECSINYLEKLRHGLID